MADIFAAFHLDRFIIPYPLDHHLRTVWFSWERLPPGPKVFRGVLPRRWVVERTFAWLCQNRRFSRDYERLCTNSDALIYAAMARYGCRMLGMDLVARRVFPRA